MNDRSVHILTINGGSFTYLRNEDHAKVISTDTSRFAVRVIHTDEELMIARLTLIGTANYLSVGQIYFYASAYTRIKTNLTTQFKYTHSVTFMDENALTIFEVSNA